MRGTFLLSPGDPRSAGEGTREGRLSSSSSLHMLSRSNSVVSSRGVVGGRLSVPRLESRLWFSVSRFESRLWFSVPRLESRLWFSVPRLESWLWFSVSRLESRLWFSCSSTGISNFRFSGSCSLDNLSDVLLLLCCFLAGVL